MPATVAEEDAAWVVIETRARLDEVRRFVGSIERLFRINPYLEIDAWTQPQPHAFRVELRNLSNGRRDTLSMALARTDESTLLIVYADGLKRSTCIEVEPCALGSRVRITEDYSGLPAGERLARSAEVDRSLTAWGIALRAYLDREHRYGRSALWHLWLDRMWLPMRPAARRIAYILVAIAVAEVAVAALVVLVLWLEGRTAR